MTVFEAAFVIPAAAIAIFGVAVLYSLLRAVKRSTRRTLDRA